MIDIRHQTRGRDNMICVFFEGRLTQKEYLVFRPQLESMIRHHEGLRLVFVMDDGLRWEPRSMWRKLSFDSRHRTSVARLGVVGESAAWRRWILAACQCLSVHEAAVFTSSQESQALLWAGAPTYRVEKADQN